MMGLILYALLSASMFYLGSRALITQAIWTRYPARVARFMDCAACTGFWWGTIWALIIGRRFAIDVGPLPAGDLMTPPLAGLCMICLAPLAAAMMQWGLDTLGVLPVELPGQRDPDDFAGPASFESPKDAGKLIVFQPPRGDDTV